MVKCNTKTFGFKLSQMGKMKNTDYILIDILEDLTSCSKIKTRTGQGTGTNLGTAIFNNAAVPEDAFGCSQNKCANTGTLQGTATAVGDVIFPYFQKNMEAVSYSAGIVTAYVLLPAAAAGASFTVKLSLADYADATFTNADEFETTIKPELGAGFYPVLFDLANVTDSVGNGWVPSQLGVSAQITVSAATAAGQTFGVSSLGFFESIADLKVNKTVVASCPDSVGDTQSLDVLQSSTCGADSYDENSGQMTGTITVNQISNDELYLNPTMTKSDETTTGTPAAVTREVTAETINGTDYGVIQLSDMVENECGFMYVQTSGCVDNASSLNRVASPVPVALDGSEYQVLTTVSGLANKGKILVGKDWVGTELNIVYLRETDADIYDYTNDWQERRVRIMAPFRYKDRSIRFNLYENVFITASANNISRTDDTAFEIQFTASADANGLKKRTIIPKENFVY